MNRSKTSKISSIFVFLAVFSFSFIFFFNCHPLAVLDFDDWSYISGFRIPLPVPTFWNPSRVLPECLMPFCGFCGSVIHRIFPSVEYVRSLSISIACFLAVFIALYALAFYCFSRKCLGIPEPGAILLTGIFISLHFLIYRVSDSGNYYAFYPGSVTGCFFYIIPALANASLVLFFESSGAAKDFFAEKLTFSKFVLLACIYFAVFSNLFGSIILSSYVLIKILGDIFTKEANLIKRDLLYIAILLLWLVAVVFEGLGGRAGVSYDFITCIQMNSSILFDNIMSNIKGVNILFYILLLTAFVLCIVKKRRELRIFVLSGIITGCFLILLCIKVNPSTILLPQVRFGFVFFVLVVVSSAFYKLGSIILALILSACVLFSCSAGKTFADSLSYGGIDAHTAIKVSQNCVDQIVAADKSGLNSVEMHVFDSSEDLDNWPQTFDIGVPIGKALLRHGVIGRTIDITVFVDSSLNELYNIS